MRTPLPRSDGISSMQCGGIDAARVARWAAQVVCCLTIAGCGSDSGFPDSRALPLRLEQTRAFRTSVSSVDFDGDGVDELVRRYHYERDLPYRHGVLLLGRQNGSTIDQLNHNGWVQRPVYMDIDHDARPEILAPVVRGDSLFVAVADGNGRKLFGFFLINGQARWEPEGPLPWVPEIVDFHLADANLDGRDDLITVFTTGYARLPRGVAVHSLPDGRLLGKKVIGAGITDSALDDFDGDGSPELVVATAASNNGGQAGGFDDAHSYLIVFNLDPTPTVAWARELEGVGWARLAYDDFDGDGRRQLMLASATANGATFELLDTQTWRAYRQRSVKEPVWLGYTGFRWLDIDRDARSEFVFIRQAGGLLIVGDSLDQVEAVPIRGPGRARHLVVLPDLDDDGISEIAAVIPGAGVLLLDTDGTVKAAYAANRPLNVSPLLRGAGRLPHVLVEDEGGTSVLEVSQNRLYWVFRYGPGLLGTLALLLPVAGVMLIQRWRTRVRLSEAVQALALEARDRCLLLLDRKGGIRWMSPAMRRRLKLSHGSSSPPERLDDLADAPAELVQLCRGALATSPPKRQAVSGSVRLGEGFQEVTFVAEPVIAGVRGDPHWLVSMGDAGEAAENLSRTWALMARRVAHTLKSPLTSILLSLERLQMEYRERAPAVANRLDRYTSRIEERIGELRRLTNNFLKFVNVEEPEMSRGDLNGFVAAFSDALRRTLPPDIRLKLKLQRDLPPALFDRDQMQDVLDNLIVNAINAMPEGGTITIGTALASGVHLTDGDAARDFVQLEVMDTGVGIGEAVRERLFEPGFSATTNGSGLGLAIVKKIIEDHGGEVVVESEVGAGSAFTVLLPLNGDDPETTVSFGA